MRHSFISAESALSDRSQSICAWPCGCRHNWNSNITAMWLLLAFPNFGDSRLWPYTAARQLSQYSFSRIHAFYDSHRSRLFTILGRMLLRRPTHAHKMIHIVARKKSKYFDGIRICLCYCGQVHSDHEAVTSCRGGGVRVREREGDRPNGDNIRSSTNLCGSKGISLTKHRNEPSAQLWHFGHLRRCDISDG